MEYMNYITINKMKVNYLKHIFKKDSGDNLLFNKNHFDNYCFETTELFSDICGLLDINTEQLEGFTKRLFESHLFQLLAELKKGIEHNVDFSTLQYIIEKFLFINFGAFINKQFIIENLIRDFDNNGFLSQFPSIEPYITKDEYNEILLDYSDSSGREKIVFLHKLGVIDFLKEKKLFLSSTNKLAEYLSAVTGEKLSTLQSYLNPMFSKDTIAKNNPLKSDKLVKTVEQKLISMGFNSSDFE